MQPGKVSVRILRRLITVVMQLAEPQSRNSQGEIDAHLSFDGQRL
jgi:hypothetical protein